MPRQIKKTDLTYKQLLVFLAYLKYYYRYRQPPSMRWLGRKFDVYVNSIASIFGVLVRKGYLGYIEEYKYYYPTEWGLYKLFKSYNKYEEFNISHNSKLSEVSEIQGISKEEVW